MSFTKVAECYAVEVTQTSLSSNRSLEDIVSVRDGLHEMASTFPTAPNNLILQLILGNISVILPNREDKFSSHNELWD